MSDERDETRSFSPFDDDTWADDAAGPGRRRPSPSSRGRESQGRESQGGETQSWDAEGRDDDRTRFQPAVDDEDRTRVQPGAPDAATVVNPAARPPDATSVMPPAEAAPAWSGRAEVRAPQPARTEYQQVTDWPAGPAAQRSDRWWMPIVVGIIALVLLAALGWGIYLIFQNAGKNNSPAPATTTSAAPTTQATTETTQPTTAPTTTQPSTTASTTEPTAKAVAIPALRGLSVADAKSALQDVGITSTRVIYKPSDAEPGTVIDSDPEEGQEVPPDTRVTLVVSTPVATATTTTTTTAGTGAGN